MIVTDHLNPSQELPMPQDETAAFADDHDPFEHSLQKGLSDSEKIDQIHESVRLLVDEIRKLTAFLTAPKDGPSALDALTKAIAELAAETRAQGEILNNISATLLPPAGK
jgi:hypothetical protein